MRDYNALAYAEEGTTLVVYLDDADGSARFSFVTQKLNLRKKRAATGEKRTKHPAIKVTRSASN